LTAAVSTEEARALAAEAVLQADIDQNEADADSAIAAEEARAVAAEAVLTAGLSTEESRAVAAEAALTASLSTEAARALAAEVALQADIDQNESDSDAMFAQHSADIAALYGRDVTVASVLASSLASGTSVDLSALPDFPLSSVTFIAVNGLVMMPGLDYDVDSDVDGNITGYTLNVGIYAGDSVVIKGQSAFTLQS